MCRRNVHFLSFIAFSRKSAGSVVAPQVGREGLLQLAGCPVRPSASLRGPRARFPAPRLEARQLPQPCRGGQGGGETSGSGPLNCTSDPYCLSFCHLCFLLLSLASKVTANFWATHITQVSGNKAPTGQEGEAPGREHPLARGALPPASTPQAGKLDPVGGAGNSPVCGGAVGGGERRECRPWR